MAAAINTVGDLINTLVGYPSTAQIRVRQNYIISISTDYAGVVQIQTLANTVEIEPKDVNT